jgi:hypothetical protein
MPSFLIVCRLEPEPPGKLPPWGGLLDVVDEHGLYSLVIDRTGVRLLPEGMLGGRFVSPQAALAAFDEALVSASDLLGYPVRASSRDAYPAEAASMPAFAAAEDSACPSQSSFIPSGPIEVMRVAQ